jgi:hypothetical protein
MPPTTRDRADVAARPFAVAQAGNPQFACMSRSARRRVAYGFVGLFANHRFCGLAKPYMFQTGRRCGFRWNKVIICLDCHRGLCRITAANPRSLVEMHALTTVTLDTRSPNRSDP